MDFPDDKFMLETMAQALKRVEARCASVLYRQHFPHDDIMWRCHVPSSELDAAVEAAVQSKVPLNDDQVREFGLFRAAWVEPGAFY